jgi:hypothetical protein
MSLFIFSQLSSVQKNKELAGLTKKPPLRECSSGCCAAAGGDDSPRMPKRHRRMYSSNASTTRYRGGTPLRRGSMRKTSSTAQPGQGRGLLTATSMWTAALASAEWAARPIAPARAGCAVPAGWRRWLYVPCILKSFWHTPQRGYT